MRFSALLLPLAASGALARAVVDDNASGITALDTAPLEKMDLDERGLEKRVAAACVSSPL